jgi:hypothetical protein
MLEIFKRKKAKEVMQRVDTLKLGEKTVRIKKITPREYKEIFAVIGSIPNLVYNVANAPEGQYQTYLLTALDVGLDDFINVVSSLTGIEAEYLHDEVGLYDLTEYLAQMVAFNDLDKTLKNVMSLLPKLTAEATTEAEAE